MTLSEVLTSPVWSFISVATYPATQVSDEGTDCQCPEQADDGMIATIGERCEATSSESGVLRMC